MSKMGPLNRSGHAVSLFLADSGATFGIRSKTRPKPQCYRGCRAMQAKTLVFFVGFKCDVWQRGGVKCMSKMGPLNRSGHAVSLFLADSGATFGIQGGGNAVQKWFR